ncbi:MAG: hypothetical protein ACI376_00170 [Candidatus Bruticola sp.]
MAGIYADNKGLDPELSRFSTTSLKSYLDEHTVRLLRGVEPPRATLRQLKIGLASKDFLDCDPLYRCTIGRWLLCREYKIYRRLEGLNGIAQHISMPHPHLLCMEYLQGGRDLKAVAPGELPYSALEQLIALIEQIHARGVIHFDIGHDSNGDYGRETNILWKDGQIYIIDFAGAVCGVPQPIFDMLAVHDRMAIVKVIRRFFPEEKIDPHWLPSEGQAKILRFLRKM